MSRLDVLLVGDGSSVHTRRLAEALRDRDVTVGIAAFEGEPIDGVTWIRIGSRRPADDTRYPLAIPRLARAIRRYRPAIVHGHYVSSYGLVASLARRLAHPRGGPALVQTAWGTDLLVTAVASGLRRRLAALALRDAVLITSDSSDLESAAVALAPGREMLRFVFGPPEAIFEQPRTPERVVLSSRRLDPDMRVGLIIKGFAAARASDPGLADWRLVVAGAGSEADDLRALADGLPVEFSGQLRPHELAALLSQASVYVSVPVSDATSAALLESMAAGATPVVNELPANREWVDETVGIVVPRDPTTTALGEAIAAAIRDPADPDVVRARVRECAWEGQVTRLIQAYEKLGVLRTHHFGFAGRSGR
jgi:glycosyltransferase involved in cell wall biosynthesis